MEDTPENIEIFKKVYTILIEAVQTRIGNKANIEDKISNFLESTETYEGLEIIKTDKLITYRLDITKKIGIETTKIALS